MAIDVSLIVSSQDEKRWCRRVPLGAELTTKKRKPVSSKRRPIVRIERRSRALAAHIARSEKDTDLGLATQDHFVLWRRPALFEPWPLELRH